MVFTDAFSIGQKVNAAFVIAVKEVMRAHTFLQDVWYNYCHEHAPADFQYNTVTRDPARYSVGFLGDFLQHVANKCQDEDALQEFSRRKHMKVDRLQRHVSSFQDDTVRHIDSLWFVVGESVLHGTSNMACSCVEVALPSDLMHHSGSAVATLIGCRIMFPQVLYEGRHKQNHQTFIF